MLAAAKTVIKRSDTFFYVELNPALENLNEDEDPKDGMPNGFVTEAELD